MNGLVIRVAAYHGKPINVGIVPTRAGISHDTPVATVINDPTGTAVTWDKSFEGGAPSEYDLDALVNDFQDEYGCKVNIGLEPTVAKDASKVQEFDVFEPAWEDQEEAQSVVDELTRRLVDWCEGYPSGR